MGIRTPIIYIISVIILIFALTACAGSTSALPPDGAALTATSETTPESIPEPAPEPAPSPTPEPPKSPQAENPQYILPYYTDVGTALYFAEPFYMNDDEYIYYLMFTDKGLDMNCVLTNGDKSARELSLTGSDGLVYIVGGIGGGYLSNDFQMSFSQYPDGNFLYEFYPTTEIVLKIRENSWDIQLTELVLDDDGKP